MIIPTLAYTRELYKKAVDQLKLGPRSHEFLAELMGFQTFFSSDIMVKLPNPEQPGVQRFMPFHMVRAHHRVFRGSHIFGGGTRFYPYDTDEQMDQEIKNLAMLMSIKPWGYGLPQSGGKGGININPHKFSFDSLQCIVDKMTEVLTENGIIGPFKDRLATDVGTTGQMMDWVVERFGYIRNLGQTKNQFYEGVASGKTGKSGIPYRQKATGVGLHFALKAFRKYTRVAIMDEPTAAVIGSGSVGLNFVANSYHSNTKIEAVADLCDNAFGGIHNPAGLPIEDLVNYVSANPKKSVQGFENVCPGTRKITDRMEFISLPVNIFVPAAMENEITEKEAAALQCQILLEGGNSTTSKAGDETARDRGITIIPGEFANATANIVSYFEHGHATATVGRHPEAPIPYERDDDTVEAAIQTYIMHTGERLVKMAKEKHVDFRLAFYMLALLNVFPIYQTKRRLNGA